MLRRQSCCLTGEKRIVLFIKPSKLKQFRNNSFYLRINRCCFIYRERGSSTLVHCRRGISRSASTVRCVKCRHNVLSLRENFRKAREFQHKIAR